MSASPLLGQVADPVAPPTPAGKAAAEWADAFNSADSTRLRAYLDRYQLVRSMTAQLEHRNRSGGFGLVSIERSTPRYIELVMKARATGTRSLAIFELDTGAAPRMKNFIIQDIPSGMSAADFTIDSARRASVIEGTLDALRNGYVFAEVEGRMIADVRARFRRGDYDGITNGLTLAARLTEHLQAASRDRHVRVSFSVGGSQRQSPAAASPPPSCGFSVSRHRDGNVGVIKFNEFLPVEECAREATRALELVAEADALIFDLRENIGGQVAMGAYITSYLLDERTQLNTVMSRRRDPATKRLALPEYFFTHPEWTPAVPGRKYGGRKPVYILTSRLTFSAAEAFAYNLQALKRATIVGEQTGGGAHLFNAPIQIDERFRISVPHMRSVNPVTGSNWEGTGVTPDVRVPATQALDTAKRLLGKSGSGGLGEG